MRIWRVVSHAIQPVPSPPEASRSTSTPPSLSPVFTVVVVKVYFVSCFVILFKISIAWQCSTVASWCASCKGMPRFSTGVMVYWL